MSGQNNNNNIPDLVRFNEKLASLQAQMKRHELHWQRVEHMMKQCNIEKSEREEFEVQINKALADMRVSLALIQACKALSEEMKLSQMDELERLVDRARDKFKELEQARQSGKYICRSSLSLSLSLCLSLSVSLSLSLSLSLTHTHNDLVLYIPRCH